MARYESGIIKDCRAQAASFNRGDHRYGEGWRRFGTKQPENIRRYATNVEAQVLRGCGHWIPEECASALNPLIVSFLGRPLRKVKSWQEHRLRHDTRDATDLSLRRDFCNVIAKWRLTQAEVRMVLALKTPSAGVVQPCDLGPDAVLRAELLVELDLGLQALLGDIDRVSAWLRMPARPFAGATPLEAMGDLDALIGMHRVARLRPLPRHSAERTAL